MADGFRKDDDLSSRTVGPTYVDDRGRALTFLVGKYAALYLSVAELRAWLSRVAESQSNPVGLARLLPSQEVFLERIEASIHALSEHIGVKELGFVESDLREAGRRLAKTHRGEVLSPPLLEWVVSYVGECIRRAVAGRWGMLRTADEWEPWIVSREGKGIRALDVLAVLEEGTLSDGLPGFVRVATGDARVWQEIASLEGDWLWAETL